VLPDRQHITYIILEYKIIYYAIKNHIYIRRHGFFALTVRGFYILLLNTTLSEKIALPAIKATIAIIGRLIVAPAIPADIPINIDRPKVSNITTKAYHCG